MTQEEKAKRYDKALESIKELYSKGSRVVVSKEEFENIFPELKESESGKNKRISKEIIQFLKQNNGWNREWLTWLEKQGNKTEEYIFRPIVGCIIDEAAQQAIDKATNGENIVFSFNGFYMKIYKDTTIDNIINSYNDFCKKQAPKPKWTVEDEELCQDALDVFEALGNGLEPLEDYHKLYDWLKRIKQREQQ